MGAGSLYLWLYVLCGLFVTALVVLGAVLFRMGRDKEPAGRTTRLDSTEEDSTSGHRAQSRQPPSAPGSPD